MLPVSLKVMTSKVHKREKAAGIRHIFKVGKYEDARNNQLITLPSLSGKTRDDTGQKIAWRYTKDKMTSGNTQNSFTKDQVRWDQHELALRR